jgi:DNA-directed RNA polymerase III subunit RPC6
LPAFSVSLWNDQDEENDEESGDEVGTSAKRKRKKRSDDSDEDKHLSRKKRKRKGREVRSGSDESESESDERDRRKRKRKKRKGESSDEESGSDTEPEVRKKKKRREKRSRASSSLSPSPSAGNRTTIGPLGVIGGGTVYRALLEPPSASHSTTAPSKSGFYFGGIFGGGIFGIKGGTGGGLMDAPCGACPVFEFCKDGGPVNPRECVYYEEWLGCGSTRKGVDGDGGVETDMEGVEVKMEG